MKKIVLLCVSLFAWAGMQQVSAQKTVDVRYSQARLIEPIHSVHTKPLIADLVVDSKLGKITHTFHFTMKEINALQGNLENVRARALFKITRTPRTVEIMQRNQPVLHVGPCSHLGSAAHEHAHLTGAHLREQLLLLDLRVGFMDERNLPGGHTVGDELFPNVIIDVEGVLLRGIIGKKGFASALRSSYCSRALGRGNITEDELGQVRGHVSQKER